MGRRRKRRSGRGSQELVIETRELELAYGHDGFFRGHPEPALIVGAFLVMDEKAHLLGRSIARFAPNGGYPMTLAPTAPTSIRSRRAFYRGRLGVLLVALEEDQGSAAQKLYARFEHPGELWVWRASEAVPAPATLDALERGPVESGDAEALVGNRDIVDFCAGDHVVGSHLFVVPPVATEEDRRVRFLSPDRRNDWTALLRLRVPGAAP